MLNGATSLRYLTRSFPTVKKMSHELAVDACHLRKPRLDQGHSLLADKPQARPAVLVQAFTRMCVCTKSTN